MNKLLSLMALGLALSSGGAFAASHAGAPMTPAAGAGCEAKAAEKKLSGAAKTSFVKKCETDAGMSCEARAADKKLSGAAKTSFVKKCETDAGPSACDTQAAEKKLAGAAKTSFLKKCETDAKAAKT